MSQKNIIFILTDDLGYGDCSCYGQETWTTPHIDQLAREGARFTDFYTTSPVCSPARASLLTGLHSGHLPIRNLFDPYLPDDIETIPKALKAAGYTSACIGKYGVGNDQPHADALKKGFDYHYGYNCMRHAHNYYPPFLCKNGAKVMLRNKPPAGDSAQWETGVGVAEVKIDYSPDFIEEAALNFIEEQQHIDQPFFLHYCPTLPHANNEGWVNDDPAKQTADGMEVDTYGEFAQYDWSPNEKGFTRMVQRIDITIGRIVEKVKELGIAQDTVIFFSSDNGPHDEGGHSVTRFNSSGGLQGYKRSLHEGGIRVPFVAWCPDTIQPTESDALHYFPDILNTMRDIAGLPASANNDGMSLWPLLQGDQADQKKHSYLYFEYNKQIGIRKEQWKYFQNEQGEESIYNLSQDRAETSNLIDSQPSLHGEFLSFIKSEHQEHTPCPVPEEMP